MHIPLNTRSIPKGWGLRFKAAIKFFPICGISGVTEKNIIFAKSNNLV